METDYDDENTSDGLENPTCCVLSFVNFRLKRYDAMKAVRHKQADLCNYVRIYICLRQRQHGRCKQ